MKLQIAALAAIAVLLGPAHAVQPPVALDGWIFDRDSSDYLNFTGCVSSTCVQLDAHNRVPMGSSLPDQGITIYVWNYENGSIIFSGTCTGADILQLRMVVNGPSYLHASFDPSSSNCRTDQGSTAAFAVNVNVSAQGNRFSNTGVSNGVVFGKPYKRSFAEDIWEATCDGNVGNVQGQFYGQANSFRTISRN